MLFVVVVPARDVCGHIAHDTKFVTIPNVPEDVVDMGLLIPR